MKKLFIVMTILFLFSWQSLLAESNLFTALQWYNYARQLETQGRYTEAIAAYDVVIQKPDATQQTCIACTWAHRGLCFDRLGDYGNAAASYARALKYQEIDFARKGLGRILAMIQSRNNELSNTPNNELSNTPNNASSPAQVWQRQEEKSSCKEELCKEQQERELRKSWREQEEWNNSVRRCILSSASCISRCSVFNKDETCSEECESKEKDCRNKAKNW